MVIFWSIVAGLAAYSVPGIIMFNTALEDKRKRGARSYEDPDMMDEFFKACFWPLIYFVNVVMSTHKASSKKFKETAETKVKNYSETPTKILAQLISTKITKEPDNLNLGSERWTSSDGKVSIWYSAYSRSISGIYELKVNDKRIELSVEDEKIIIKALNQAETFNFNKREADLKAAKQLVALEAVESLLLTPEPTPTTNKEKKK